MQQSETLVLIKEFSNVIQEFNHKAFKFVNEQLNKTGLVRTHFDILHELIGGKELSMSELSGILHVTKPNITVLIDKLVKLDYVERVNSHHDRRVILIRLTRRGEIFANDLAEVLMMSSMQLLDRLSEEDLELLKQTTENMKKLLPRLK